MVSCVSCSSDLISDLGMSGNECDDERDGFALGDFLTKDVLGRDFQNGNDFCLENGLGKSSDSENGDDLRTSNESRDGEGCFDMSWIDVDPQVEFREKLLVVGEAGGTKASCSEI